MDFTEINYIQKESNFFLEKTPTYEYHLDFIKKAIDSETYRSLPDIFDRVLDRIMISYPQITTLISNLIEDFNETNLKILTKFVQDTLRFAKSEKGEMIITHYLGTTLVQINDFHSTKNISDMKVLDCKFPTFVFERILNRFFKNLRFEIVSLVEHYDAHPVILLHYSENSIFFIDFIGAFWNCDNMDKKAYQELKIYNHLGTTLLEAALQLDFQFAYYIFRGMAFNSLYNSGTTNADQLEIEMANFKEKYYQMLSYIKKKFPEFNTNTNFVF